MILKSVSKKKKENFKPPFWSMEILKQFFLRANEIIPRMISLRWYLFDILFEKLLLLLFVQPVFLARRVQRHNLKENKNLLARSSCALCRLIDLCDQPTTVISLTFQRNLLSTKLSLSSIMDEFTLRVFRPTLLCMLGPKASNFYKRGERCSNNARSGTQTSSPS